MESEMTKERVSDMKTGQKNLSNIRSERKKTGIND